ncbi:MAG: hypothetical protein AAGA76_14550 [Pseudomonadota bacterium]
MRPLVVSTLAVLAGAIGAGLLAAGAPKATNSAVLEDLDWTTSRHTNFDRWESVCEISDPTDPKGPHERCYMRFVDKFGHEDKSDAADRFGKIAAYITPDGDGLRVEFDVENGLTFNSGGFHLAREDKAVWTLDGDDCLSMGQCSFNGPAADALVKAFSDQTAETLYMHVEFTDRYGQQLQRSWPMQPFASAFADFENNVRLTSAGYVY